ncbi:S-layer homology domain-containing protein [Microbacteriaceae bacterium VKM Ac-2854]|nr:S-layer homology domain-containing protein [Microbacteriaceae bacterium VKM Ac-2854]
MRRLLTTVVAVAATIALTFGGATAASAEEPNASNGRGVASAASNGPVHIEAPVEAGSPQLAVEGRLGVLTVDAGPATLDEATGEVTDHGTSSSRYSIATTDGDMLAITGEFPAGLATGSTVTATLAIPDKVAEALPAESRDVSGRTPIDAGSPIGASVIDAAVDLDAEFAVVVADIVPQAAVAGSVQPVHVAVVAPNGSGVSPNFFSDVQVSTLIGTLGSFWEGQSEGRISDIPLQAPIKHYTSAYPGCSAGATDSTANVEAMWNEATAAFGYGNSWQNAAYEGAHIVVLTPDLGCDYIGLGSIGYPTSGGIFQSVVGIGVDNVTAQHEFGHNLGLGHANTYGCTDPAYVEDGAGCSVRPYGDYYDVMGIALCTNVCWDKAGAINLLDRLNLGWTTVPQYTLAGGESSHTWTVTLDAISATSGARGVEAVDPISGYVYDLEYRNAAGADAGTFYASQNATSSYRSGVRVVYGATDEDDWSSYVQATMPASSNPSFRSLALQAGDTFGSQAAGFSVSVLSQTASTATVQLTARTTPQLAPAASGPRIAGGTAIGSTLTIERNNWNLPGLSFSTTWLRDGSPVGSGSSYTTVAADEGGRITAQITASRTDYLSGTATTDPLIVDSRPHAFTDVLPTHPFFDDIEWMSSSGLSTGYDNGDGTKSYRPNDVVSRQAMAAFLYRESGDTFTAPAKPSFVDVPTSHPFFREIEWMKSAGISTGTKNADGTLSYNPNGAVSREAMAAFLARMSGDTIPTPTTQVFVDVPPSNAFYKEITWMYTTGISTGYSDHTYRPAAPVSRQAMSAFLHRYDTTFGD